MLDLGGLADRLHGCTPEQAAERLRYASYVSHKHRYVFVETPKAACTTLKWIIELVEGVERKPGIAMQSSLKMSVHARGQSGIPSLCDLALSDLERICHRDSDWVRFCAVRNPYARVVSAWADKIRQREPGYAWTWKQIALHCGRPADRPVPPSFAEFLDWVVRKQRPRACNHHWRPMVYLLLPDLLNYTHVLRTETLAADLAAVLARIGASHGASGLLERFAANESLPVNWRGFYDEAAAGKVYRYYKDDFDCFGYDPRSWRGGGEASEPLTPRLEKLEAAALGAIRERNDMIAYLSGLLAERRRERKAMDG